MNRNVVVVLEVSSWHMAVCQKCFVELSGIHEWPNAQVSGAGAPKVRRAPTQAMTMPKAWPVLASA